MHTRLQTTPVPEPTPLPTATKQIDDSPWAHISTCNQRRSAYCGGPRRSTLAALQWAQSSRHHTHQVALGSSVSQ